MLSFDSTGSVVGVRNYTIPGIVQRGFLRKADASASKDAAIQAVLLNHPKAANIKATLRFRAKSDRCDPAELVVDIRYTVGGSARRRIVDGRSNAVLSDEERAPSVDATSEVEREDCQTSTWSKDYLCMPIACSSVSNPDARLSCEATRSLWDFWAQPRNGKGPELHEQDRLSRYSYDASNACMKVKLSCADDGRWTSPPIEVVTVGGDYTTKGVIAHEFGHALLDHVGGNFDQDVSVGEHIADVHAMIALTPTTWYVAKNTGEIIRRWDNPSLLTQVTAQGGTHAARFPNTFDDYNTHGDPRSTAGGIYRSYHVASTLWSHLVYNYAHEPGVGRQNAIETVYRVAVSQLAADNDLSFSLYQNHLQNSANALGLGNQMKTARAAAKLWPAFSDTTGTNAYTRPAIVSGLDHWFVFVPTFYVTSAPALRVFVNRYAIDLNGNTTDQIVELGRDAQGVWHQAVTNVDPSTVAGALSGAYANLDYFLAWKTSTGAINFAKRSSLLGLPWTPVATINGVNTNADPALASDGNMLLLFYRDAATGGLGIVRWTSAGWGTPTVLNSFSLASAPSASWDGQAYRLSWLDSTGQAQVLRLWPSGATYGWDPPGTLTSCFFNTSAGAHAWAILPSVEIAADKLYLIGAGLDGNSLVGKPRIEQAVLQRVGSSSSFDISDPSHGQLDRIADGVDTAVHEGKLWMVTWTSGYPAGTWSVVGKTP